MLDLLRQGEAASEVKSILREHPEAAGDVLWTVAQLDDVGAFASDAGRYLSSTDKATAAYAMEIVLRGAKRPGEIRVALDCLSQVDVAVREHAVRTLAGEGMERLTEILNAAGGVWSELSDELGPHHFQIAMVEDLLRHPSLGFHVIGVVLASLIYERNKSAIQVLRHADESWIRDYAAWLAGE